MTDKIFKPLSFMLSTFSHCCSVSLQPSPDYETLKQHTSIVHVEICISQDYPQWHLSCILAQLNAILLWK